MASFVKLTRPGRTLRSLEGATFEVPAEPVWVNLDAIAFMDAVAQGELGHTTLTLRGVESPDGGPATITVDETAEQIASIES